MSARHRVLAAAFFLSAATISAQALYWESPAFLEANSMRWSSSGTGAGRIVLAWEDIVPTPGKNEGAIYLSAAGSVDGITWSYTRRFAGPIRYSGLDPGQEPQVYSMVVAPDGRVFLAAATAEKEITVFGAEKGGLSFQVLARLTTPLTSVIPSIFMTAGGNLLLFATTAPAGADATSLNQAPLTLVWSYSSDGRTWSPLGPFVAAGEAASGIILQPDYASFGGRDVVVFQSVRLASAGSDVYTKTSSDGGRTWGATQAVTSLPAFQEKVAGVDHPPNEFTNERPRLFPLAAGLTLIWERRLLGSPTASLYSIGLDAGGAAKGTYESLTPGVSSILGQVITLGQRTLLLYSQNSGGTYRTVLSEKTDAGWVPSILGRTLVGSAQFPHAAVLGGSLFIFWENGPANPTSPGGTSLVELRPKKNVASPDLVAIGFTPGKPEKADTATIRWQQPDDSVGIDAYEVTLSLNGKTIPPAHVVRAASALPVTFQWPLPADGTWRFQVVAIDLAQNRSPPSTMDFVRDTTPPGAVVVAAPAAGPDGFLPSNSFTVSWAPPPDADVAGYTWEEQAVGSLADYQQGKPPLKAPPARVMTTRTSLAFGNLENGLHAITVAAVDAAGNVGPRSTILVQLNKFAPFTAIYALLRSVDEAGNVAVTVRGRGFISNGTVDEIYLSRSAAPPYDYRIKAGPGGFTVVSDSLITGLVLTNSYASGTYRIGLHQQSRPAWFWPGGSLSFESPGTVRFGNFSLPVPRWLAGTAPRLDISFNTLLVVAVVALLAVLLVFSVGRLASLAQEGAVLRGEIVALLEGRPSAGTRERDLRMKELKKRGIGLRVKFTLLMVALVSIVVLGVSVILSVQMISSSSTSLAAELQKRTNILISTIAAQAQVEIQKGPTGPTSGQVGIIAVPDNKSQMAEAVYVTITGPAAVGTDTISRDYVWASNSDAWKKRGSTFEFAAEVENDALSPQVDALKASVNDAALAAVSDLLSRQQAARDRATALGAKANRTAAESAELTTAIKTSQDTFAQINALAAKLPEAGVRSLPVYDPARITANTSGRYLFYKPVVFYLPSDKTFYQGLVRMEVDTASITDQIARSRNELIRTSALIALIAIGLGVLGAIIMANITVTPIRKLAQAVTRIGATEDKEELKEFAITVKTRDEIGALADTVNDMTQGLVKAAVANKLLLGGKEVQKMFLPLARDTTGGKGSTAEEDGPRLEIFGYYEGAKGVSGDYFDFKKLDDDHYAIIKCDVSGKGVPAALIMVEVATLFINNFSDWHTRRSALLAQKGPAEKTAALREFDRLDPLVYRINDMIEERGFKGLFAALTMCLLDARTGVATVCNAGDTILNIYEAQSRKMTHIKLPNSPAAGAIASVLVEMKAPYRPFTRTLAPGDTLFMTTDGIEESKRKLRSAAFEPILCDVDGHSKDSPGGTHDKGDPEGTEDFTTGRMDEVLNAVFTRGRYRLVRAHNPIPDEPLEFDFSTCQGTAREATLALVSVEKVYRMVPDPSAGPDSRVMVDEKLVAFLKEHFLQYDRYFSHPQEKQAVKGYITFSHAREDDQYDDLTILVIRRK